MGRQILHQFPARMANLQKCSHPNIVQFIGVYYPNHRHNRTIPTIVMEKMDCSLTTYIERDGPLPLHRSLSIIHDVSLGLWYLHSHSPPIIHCGLNPNEVLLVNTNSVVPRAKLAGLGEMTPEYFEHLLDDEKLPRIVFFKSPEIEKIPQFSLPLDVFSYGGVVLYAVVGKWPMPTNPEKFDPKTSKWVVVSEVERRQEFLDEMTGEAKVLRPLAEECLNNSPAQRPTIEIVSERINQIKMNYMDKYPETKVIWCNS